MLTNPFSLHKGQAILGKKIKDWCKNQIDNEGSHKKQAEILLRHYTFIDDRKYFLEYGPFGPGQDPCKNEYPQIRFTTRKFPHIVREYEWMKPQSFFYTAEPVNKAVSEEEFYEFIKNYPRKLERDVFGVCDPPAVSYNDFELANRWPYSIVASTWLFSDDPEDEYYVPKKDRTYRIVVNHEELFNSKTGNKA